MRSSGAPEGGGVVACAQCGWHDVPRGPHGGYVCPLCFYTETPD